MPSSPAPRTTQASAGWPGVDHATRMKMIVEPTGCLGLAAARRMAPQLKGQRIGVRVSGGHIDLERDCQLLAA